MKLRNWRNSWKKIKKNSVRASTKCNTLDRAIQRPDTLWGWLGRLQNDREGLGYYNRERLHIYHHTEWKVTISEKMKIWKECILTLFANICLVVPLRTFFMRVLWWDYEIPILCRSHAQLPSLHWKSQLWNIWVLSCPLSLCSVSEKSLSVVS